MKLDRKKRIQVIPARQLRITKGGIVPFDNSDLKKRIRDRKKRRAEQAAAWQMKIDEGIINVPTEENIARITVGNRFGLSAPPCVLTTIF